MRNIILIITESKRKSEEKIDKVIKSNQLKNVKLLQPSSVTWKWKVSYPELLRFVYWTPLQSPWSNLGSVFIKGTGSREKKKKRSVQKPEQNVMILTSEWFLPQILYTFIQFFIHKLYIFLKSNKKYDVKSQDLIVNTPIFPLEVRRAESCVNFTKSVKSGNPLLPICEGLLVNNESKYNLRHQLQHKVIVNTNRFKDFVTFRYAHSIVN